MDGAVEFTTPSAAKAAAPPAKGEQWLTPCRRLGHASLAKGSYGWCPVVLPWGYETLSGTQYPSLVGRGIVRYDSLLSYFAGREIIPIPHTLACRDTITDFHVPI